MANEKKFINTTFGIFCFASICCFLWGSASPSIKTGYSLFSISNDDTWSIILFAGVRFFLAGILVTLYESIKKKKVAVPEKSAWKYVFILALVQTAVQYFFFYIGLAHTSGVTTTILSGSGGFISILLVCFIFRSEKITSNKLIGVILGMLGIIVMNVSFKGGTSFNFHFLGEGMVLISQVCYALSGILVKKFSKHCPVALMSGYQFMVGGLAMILISLLCGGRVDFKSGFGGYLLLLYLALISAVAYTLWGLLMQYNPVSKVSVFSFLTPLFGVLLSALILGEVEQALQLNKLVALLLVCLGIYIVNRAPEKKVTT